MPTSSTRCCRSSTTAGSTDAQGRTVDFRNPVIIMTSNIGSVYLLDGVGPDGDTVRVDSADGEIRFEKVEAATTAAAA